MGKQWKMKPFRWQMSLAEMRRAEAVTRMAMLGKGEMILKLAGTGRLLWVSFTLRTLGAGQAAGPSAQAPRPTSGTEERSVGPWD